MIKNESKKKDEDRKDNDILQMEGVMSQGYGIMPKVVMRDRRLTVDAKAIYAYMVSFAGAGQTAFPKRVTILADLCMSKTSFYKHFQSLLDHDYVRVKRQKVGNLLGRNIYTLVAVPKDDVVIENSGFHRISIKQATKKKPTSSTPMS